MTNPAVGVGKWIGRISVSVSATEDKNFRREAAACLPSQSTLGDQSGSRHWITWCIMSPVTTARCPREKMLTQQWQGEVPRRRRQGDGIVQRVIVVDQQSLACFHDRQT